MSYRIRDFTPDDYEAVVAVTNAVYPEHRSTVDEWKHWDENRDPKCKARRFVAEVDGKVVAQGGYSQHPWIYHPHKFDLDLDVHPAFRRRGIGTALYERVLATLEPLDPIALRGRTREDFTGGMRFLQKRGFAEVERDWESRLDPAGVDLTAYNGLNARLVRNGITLTTLAELRETDPDYARKIYDLDWHASQDVPMKETITRPSFADYCKNVLESPTLIPEAFLVAVHDGAYVGTTSLWTSGVDGELKTGFTGVHRDYRRQGVALALKLQAIAYAQAHGNPTLKTWNAQANRGMLSINEALGFVKQPAWVNFKKEIESSGR